MKDTKTSDDVVIALCRASKSTYRTLNDLVNKFASVSKEQHKKLLTHEVYVANCDSLLAIAEAIRALIISQNNYPDYPPLSEIYHE
jgi:hypothetical protein